jgi:SAM-dependent methyltransferase
LTTNDPYGEDHAGIYDDLYTARGKDYAAESASVASIILTRQPHATSVLDIACGTGLHLAHLRNRFPDAAGVEPSAAMRARAIARLGGGVPVHDADMRDIRLDRQFDAVTCMFSAIGYAGGPDGSTAQLRKALDAMAAHLPTGGVLVVEPWLDPSQYAIGHIGNDFTRTDERAIYRMSHSGVHPDHPHVSVLTMDYLIGTAAGITHFTDVHVMSMFTTAELAAAFEAAGCRPEFVDPGFGRGVVVGVRR